MDAKLSYDLKCLSNNERAAYLSLEIIIHTLYFIDKKCGDRISNTDDACGIALPHLLDPPMKGMRAN